MSSETIQDRVQIVDIDFTKMHVPKKILIANLTSYLLPRYHPSKTSIKWVVKILQPSISVDDQRAGKYTSSSFSQENVDFVYASVEELKCPLVAVSEKLGLVKPQPEIFYSRIQFYRPIRFR